MEWALKRSIWREDNLYVSHCEDLEIASQGEPVDEARANLEEAIQLFFEVASFSEVMAYLPCFGPVSTPELQGQPKVRVTSTIPESQKIVGEVALTYTQALSPARLPTARPKQLPSKFDIPRGLCYIRPNN